MKSKKEKGRKWDGKSRVVNDLYRKNFDEIFGKKTEDEIEKENEEYLEEIKNKLWLKKVKNTAIYRENSSRTPEQGPGFMT